MMSGKFLVRVNAADNSVIDIDVDGRGSSQAPGIGEDTVLGARNGQEDDPQSRPDCQQVGSGNPDQILSNEGSIGVGEGGVWVVTGRGVADTKLTRLNPRSGAVDANIKMPS